VWLLLPPLCSASARVAGSALFPACASRFPASFPPPSFVSPLRLLVALSQRLPVTFTVRNHGAWTCLHAVINPINLLRCYPVLSLPKLRRAPQHAPSHQARCCPEINAEHSRPAEHAAATRLVTARPVCDATKGPPNSSATVRRRGCWGFNRCL
jgi:hypothetical protein